MRIVYLTLLLVFFCCDESSNPMASLDECGVANGDNSTCVDECGIVNGNTVENCGSCEYVFLWNECYNIESTTSINLQSSNISGIIPSSIGYLENLEYLNLYDNQLYGEIPEEITNLINLKTLVLSYNNLSGSIPYNIGNLINLTSLNLSYNELSGSIPVSIGNLVNMNSLILFHNNLSGEIPVEICNQGDSYPSVYGNNLCFSSSQPPEIDDCIIQADQNNQDSSNCP